MRQLKSRSLTDAADLTEGVRALMVRSRLRGQPSRDFQHMMDLLGKAHQELDRLYWPAKLSEAHLLLEKDNQKEALTALYETLKLNPRCSEAWYALGRVALDRFDFASAGVAAEALRRQNPDHPLADLLLAESRLIQDDPEGALELLEPLAARLPRLREAHALIAAAMAISYDEDALAAALQRYEDLSPGSARAYLAVGRHLSFNRQYEAPRLEQLLQRQVLTERHEVELVVPGRNLAIAVDRQDRIEESFRCARLGGCLGAERSRQKICVVRNQRRDRRQASVASSRRNGGALSGQTMTSKSPTPVNSGDDAASESSR